MAFITYKTSDGRWEFGTGEYDKTMAVYLGVKAPSPATTLPSKLVDAMFPQKKQYQAMKYSLVSSVTIPVFYVWGRPRYADGSVGQKRIAEWPFSKTMRDIAFGQFNLAMQAGPDKVRTGVFSQLQATAGAPSLTNLARWGAYEKKQLIYSEIDKRVRHAAAEEASGIFVVLAAAAAVGLFIAFS